MKLKHSLIAVFLLFLAVSILPGKDGLTPFSDVPPDHPAYEAVRRLIAEGYMDGYDDDTFKGRHVCTRYDFAMILARMMVRLEQIKKEQNAPPSPEEAMLMDLCREFRGELKLLGIRVDGAEHRVERVEKQTYSLEQRKSNIRMEGFYRVSQTFASRPVDYKDYPFVLDLNRFRDIDGEGLGRLRQELFLRFLGHPFIKGSPSTDVEVFAELKGLISGVVSDTLRYDFTDYPKIGDDEDTWASSIWDDKRVSLNRGHLVIGSKRGRFRAFSNEAMTELKDPLILLSDDVYTPFSGVEGEGAYKKMTYFASVLRKMESMSGRGRDPLDLWDLYKSDDDTYRDNFALRLTYAPHYGLNDESSYSFIMGLTFNETVWGYEEKYDFNRVVALDFQYDRSYGKASFESEMTVLHSYGRGRVWDTGSSLDATYRNRGLLASLKFYNFDDKTCLENAKSPFIDTDINFNFKRTRRYADEIDTIGERFLRVQGKYDVPDKYLSSLDDVTLTLLYERKWWEQDEREPRPTDNKIASRFYLQALADITDRTHFEYFTEIQKDLPQEEGAGPLESEEGTLTNEFRFDYRIRDNLALVSELAFVDDFDAHDSSGNHFSMVRRSLELNSQVTPWLFLKTNGQWIDNSDLQRVHYADEDYEGIPRDLVNGRDIKRWVGEAVITSRQDLSLRSNVMFEDVENDNWHYENMFRKVWVNELGVNFTRALKLRYVHSIDSRDMEFSDRYEHIKDRTWVNSFMSLFYRPTENTELELTYGDEYEDPRDPLDNGVFNFFKTARIVQFKAQTAF